MLQDENWKQIAEEEKNLLPEQQREKVLYIDGKLKKKLDFALSQQEKNNDVVAIISGDEGSGKSSLAGNVMRYISKDKFNPQTDMVGSDYDEGLDKIINIQDKGWLMFDEGNMFFLSTEVMKKESRDLHKIFSIFRQKCLFVLIVLPSFFRLGSYFALDRSRFLIRTYLKKGKRGFFAYHGTKNKAKLWYSGKKDYNVHAVTPNFRGIFNPCIALENPEYKKFKLKTLTKSLEIAKKKKQPTKWEIEKDFQLNIIKNNPDTPSKELAKMLGLTYRRINQLRNRIQTNEFPQKEDEI